jgi:hypothetical protein
MVLGWQRKPTGIIFNDVPGEFHCILHTYLISEVFN